VKGCNAPRLASGRPSAPRRFGISLGVALVAVAATPSPWAVAGSFVPSETIFPASTRAWISVANPQELRASFNRTQYGQLLKDPAMKPFVDGFQAQLRSAGKQRLGRLGLALEDLGKVAGGEIALAVIETAPATMASILLVDTTGREAETKTLLDRVEKRLLEQKATKADQPAAAPGMTVFNLPPEPNAPVSRQRQVAILNSAGVLVVGDSPAVVGQVVAALAKGLKDSLASLPAFQAVVARCGKQVPPSAAPLRWFVDPLGYAKL